MTARPALAGVLLLVGFLAASERDEGPERHRFAFERPAMGTTFRIVVYAPEEHAAGRAADQAFATIDRLDSLFSDYRTDSEVARLARSAGSDVRVSPELLAVLTTARAWSRRTGGAFDVTVGPLTRLWRWSARRAELPDPDRLARAHAAVGYDHLHIDAVTGTAGLTRPGMSLDLGGIGKGWAADAAMRELRALGLTSALVDAGGDVLVGAPPPGETGWRIAVPGGDHVTVANEAVATSGDGERGVEVDGVRYAHIVDPRTGLGVPDAPTVTVVAPDAATADVLASSLTVLGPPGGARLVASEPGASARVIAASGRGWSGRTAGGDVGDLRPAGGARAARWIADPHAANTWIIGDFPKRTRLPAGGEIPWMSP